jgi:hypothetical protein
MLIDMFVVVVRPLELAGRGVTHVVRLTSNTHSLVGCAPDEVLTEPLGNVPKVGVPNSRISATGVDGQVVVQDAKGTTFGQLLRNRQLSNWGRAVKEQKGRADQVQGSRSQYEGRSRRDGSNSAYACLRSDVASSALAP